MPELFGIYIKSSTQFATSEIYINVFLIFWFQLTCVACRRKGWLLTSWNYYKMAYEDM